MNHLEFLEECFRKIVRNTANYSPEIMVDVNLALLEQLNLLDDEEPEADPSLTRYFQLSESDGKLTLINEKFVIWIIPENSEEQPCTYTWIARPHGYSLPKLEMGFVTRGLFNNSRLVLRVLEAFLKEIEETDQFLKKL